MSWPQQTQTLPQAEHNAERDRLLLEWEQSKKTLEIAKVAEMEARKAAAAFLVPAPKEGVNNVELGNGYIAKMTHKVNYGLDADIDKVDDICDQIANIGNEGKFLADRLVSWKPTLSVGEYKKLDMNNPTHKAIKSLLDHVVTTKDAAPTLDIVAPKGS